jgi:tetratricopeptide (TPR) repeat protein
MVPADEQVAYLQLGPRNAGKPAAEQVSTFRAFVQKHPNYAATHNSLAYALWNTGDRDGAMASVQQYVKLAPTHANSHDSYADILMLMGRPQDAMMHVKREIEIDPAFGGQMKLGAIHLMLNDIPAARAAFAAELAVTPVPAQRFDPMTWTAITYVYAGDGKGAVTELGKVVAAAKAASAPGPEAVAHLRTAMIEAYLGNKKAVQGHLDAASGLQTPNPNHFVHRAFALSRIGNAQQAREAVEQFTAAVPNSPLIPSLNALVALDAKDLVGAESALGKTEATDVLTQALRAELMICKGQKAEAAELRKGTIGRQVKLANNNLVDFAAVVGRMRLAKM